MARYTRSSAGHVDSSSADNADATIVKTRRSHRKSRNGCNECKRRHIRCDERLPSCANCEIAELTCLFPSPKVGRQKQKQKQKQDEGQQYHARQLQRSEATATLSHGSQVSSYSNADNTDNVNMDAEHAQVPSIVLHQPKNHLDLTQRTVSPYHRPLLRHNVLASTSALESNSSQVNSPLSSMQLGDVQSPPANCLPGLSSALDAVPKATFTAQHMVLLYHAHTVPNFTGSNRSIVDIAVRYAVDSPYLLDEVLAFTAFHMMNSYPGSAVQLRHLATELQTRALASFTSFTEMIPHDNKATAVPRFLFSSILGRHVLADTVAHYCSDFHLFIDRFVECLDLNRGIRAVTPPARVYLHDSEVQPFLNIVLEAQNKITLPGNECDRLSQIIGESDLSEASTEVCRQAIKVLQWSFDICHYLDEEDYPQSASAFSVRVDIRFVDMLRKHQPEALVILAYYGVLLHRCRTFWPFGDAGASIIRTIAGHLSSYWQEALAWPLRSLEMERNTESASRAPWRDILKTSSRTPIP